MANLYGLPLPVGQMEEDIVIGNIAYDFDGDEQNMLTFGPDGFISSRNSQKQIRKDLSREEKRKQKKEMRKLLKRNKRHQ